MNRCDEIRAIEDMNTIKTSAALAICACLFAPAARTQVPGGGQAGMNAAMLKLFGEVGGFTSKADVRLQEKGSSEVMTMTVDFAMRDGKVRMDLDMGAMKTKQLPPETLAAFKAAGLDKLATIVRPDRKSTLLVYPSVQGYAEMPMSKDEATGLDRKFKIEKTRLGGEKIGGRNCQKNKVVISGENGEKHEATVWYAPDLQNFPLKVQMDQGQTVVVLQYREVKLVQPEPGRFEPPAGFTKHATVEDLMQNAMMKTLGGRK
jgi:hypothetical protein